MIGRQLGMVALAGALIVGTGAWSPVLAEPAAAGQALSGTTITLSPEETEAIKLKLIAGKPNVSTVTLLGFLFPGSPQAYMGHIDRTLIMWGGYLLVFAGSKAIWPDTSLTAGQRTSDVVVTGAFMAMAAVSALDAYLLSRADREESDRLINRLADKATPGVKGTNAVPPP